MLGSEQESLRQSTWKVSQKGRKHKPWCKSSHGIETIVRASRIASSKGNSKYDKSVKRGGLTVPNGEANLPYSI